MTAKDTFDEALKARLDRRVPPEDTSPHECANAVEASSLALVETFAAFLVQADIDSTRVANVLGSFAADVTEPIPTIDAAVPQVCGA